MFDSLRYWKYKEDFDKLPRGYRRMVAQFDVAHESWKHMRKHTVAELDRHFAKQLEDDTDAKLRAAGIEPPKRTRPSRI